MVCRTLGITHRSAQRFIPTAHCRIGFPLQLWPMASDHPHESRAFPDEPIGPVLSEATRLRLGRQLQALYEPVIDEPLDPRLAELLQQLDDDRGR